MTFEFPLFCIKILNYLCRECWEGINESPPCVEKGSQLAGERSQDAALREAHGGGLGDIPGGIPLMLIILPGGKQRVDASGL